MADIWFRISVVGKPAPGGSKKGFAYEGRDGRTHVAIVDTAKRNAGWRELVTAAAVQAMKGCGPIAGVALDVEAVFYVLRPQKHYRSDGALKPDAPADVITAPDATKLWRSTEDALSGIVWHDDAQVVRQDVSKEYVCDRHPQVGCEILIRDRAQARLSKEAA